MRPDTGPFLGFFPFRTPLPLPIQDPDSAPTKTVEVACTWLPYIRGALLTLTMQYAWPQDDPALVLQAQLQAMTLIAMFSECDSSDIPIACESFFYSGTQDGWEPEIAGGVDYGIWDGSGWEPGCMGCHGASYSQLQIRKGAAAGSHWYSMVVRYTSDVEINFNAIWNDPTPAGPTVVGNAGTDQVVTIPVNEDATVFRLVATTNPGDVVTFKITQIDIIISSPDGGCP